MVKTRAWSCDCGTVAAEVTTHPRSAVVCYCRYCRGYARYLSHEAILDLLGGTHFELTVPDQARVTAGKSALKVIRLSHNGPYRWFAGCCGTPFANVLAQSALPYAGIVTSGLNEYEAPGFQYQSFRRLATGEPPAPSGSPVVLGFGIMRRMIAARWRGGHKRSDFFDEAGMPALAPILLSEEERVRLLSDPKSET